MRVTYHTYHLFDEITKNRYAFNLKQILSALINEDIAFKNDFPIIEDENLYIIQESLEEAPNTYFFIITRDSEIIKMINYNNLSVTDIKKIMLENDRIGFGSYIHLLSRGSNFYLAFVTQTLSPKINLFWEYVDMYFRKKLDNGNFKIISHPLAATADLSEVMRMGFIGKTTIEIGKESSRMRYIKEFLGIEGAIEELAGIEVTIKPKRKQNIRKMLVGLQEFVDEKNSDIKKMTTKAKGELYSSLTDLYIIGQGGLFSSINPEQRTSKTIAEHIEKVVKNNKPLIEKLDENYQHHPLEKNIPEEFKQILRKKPRKREEKLRN